MGAPPAKLSEAQTASLSKDAPWDTSCLDWRERLLAGRTPIADLPLNRALADQGEQLFGNFVLPDVDGLPLLRSAAGPWFIDVVRALTGSFDPVTRVRYIRELFVLVPKKNSKTTYGAALMLTAMLMSTRPRAEFLLVAPTQEITALAFEQAVGMIEAETALRKRCRVQDHLRRITFKPTGAFLKVKSFSPKVLTGSKPAGALLDETHVIADTNEADRVIGQLRGGLISQPEGFLIQITTQSERPPSGVFRSELKLARAVRDGKARAAILPVLYEFPEGVDWRARSNWPLVLPNLGRSITIDRLEGEYEKALVQGKQETTRWASQHLNVQVGIEIQDDSWAGAEFWLQASDETITLDAILARCEVITVGIDGGGLDDMLGLCVLGRERRTGVWLAWLRAWLHPIAIERRADNEQHYRQFQEDGTLTIAETADQDVSECAAIVQRCHDAGLLDLIGVDRAGIGSVLDALSAVGIPNESVVAVSQGWLLGGAIKTAERRLAGGKLRHDGSDLGVWCVGNAKVEPKGNAIIVTKAVSGSGKIDPVMAMFNAVELMARNPAAKGGSWWETGIGSADQKPENPEHGFTMEGTQ